MLRRFSSRVRGILRRNGSEAELDEELAFHLEKEIEANVARGMTPVEARRVALRDLGGVTQTQEAVREVRTVWFESVWRDFRYALRRLRREPGFAAAAILTLALGIGVNTAIFSLTAAILYPPFHVPDPDRVVVVQTAPFQWAPSSYPDFRDFRDRARSFAGIAGFLPSRTAFRAGERDAEVSTTEFVTGNYFRVLGVRARIGQVFDFADDATWTEPVVVLSESFWRRRLGADPRVVGRAVILNARPVRVIGVAASGFDGSALGSPADLWAPFSLGWQFTGRYRVFERRELNSLKIIGRLKPGVTFAQAGAETRAIAHALDELPGRRRHGRVASVLVPATRATVDPAQRHEGSLVLTLLLVVVGLVLLVATFNVAGLLLARAASRRREIAVRLALGASRLRILRQAFIENLVLSMLGGAAGLVLAAWTSKLLSTLTLGGVKIAAIDLTPDLRVLSCTSGVSVLVACALSLVSIGQASQATAGSVRDIAGVTENRATRSVRSLLIGAQVSAVVLVLVAAGLFLRTLMSGLAIDLGFDARHVVAGEIDLADARYSGERAEVFEQELMRRVASLPGVEAASLSLSTPLYPVNFGNSVTIDDRGGADEEASYNVITPEYFQLLRIPIARGRDFTAQDDRGGQLAAIVNETMAKRFWQGRDVLGRTFTMQTGSGTARVTVVGIARDYRNLELRSQPEPMFFVPLLQHPESQARLLIRSADPIAMIVAAVRREIRSLDPNVPLLEPALLSDHIDAALAQERLGTRLLGTFGLLTLLISVVGIVGSVSYLVARRTREIAVRLALGANPARVVSTVVRQGMAPAALGLAAGLALSLWATRFLAHWLVGVKPTDPWTLGGVAVIVSLACTIASYLPARRATRVDPVSVLRCE